MSSVRSFFDFLLGWIPRTIKAALNLDDRQQRALFSWALTGAIVALSFGGVWLVDQIMQLVPKGADVNSIASILGDTLKLVIILMGLMAGGVVLIARGGDVTIKGPGGIELQASGPGASRELAKSVDAAAIVAPETGDPRP